MYVRTAYWLETDLLDSRRDADLLRFSSLASLASFCLWAKILANSAAASLFFSPLLLFGQVKQLPDLAGPLGSQPPGDGVVGEPGDLSLALLDDGHGEDSQVAVHDASADRLPLTLSITPGSVAAVALRQEEPGATVGEDTLLHGEPLLVVTPGDAEHVPLELISKSVSFNFLAHTLLIERPHLELVSDLNQLLAACGWEGQVDLHDLVDWISLSCRSESSKY